jgi:hypothetical protein
LDKVNRKLLHFFKETNVHRHVIMGDKELFDLIVNCNAHRIQHSQAGLCVFGVFCTPDSDTMVELMQNACTEA